MTQCSRCGVWLWTDYDTNLRQAMALHVQSLQQAANDTGTSLSTLSPAVLRSALHSAGNIVKPDEVEAVLSYVASDQRYKELDGLFLLHLNDKTVKQLHWLGNGSDRHAGKQYLTYRDSESQTMYELMPSGVAELAVRSETLSW